VPRPRPDGSASDGGALGWWSTRSSKIDIARKSRAQSQSLALAARARCHRTLGIERRHHLNEASRPGRRFAILRPVLAERSGGIIGASHNTRCALPGGYPRGSFGAHATLRAARSPDGHLQRIERPSETAGTGTGVGYQHMPNRRSRVSDRAPNNAPERQASPSNQQRRTALLDRTSEVIASIRGRGVLSDAKRPITGPPRIGMSTSTAIVSPQCRLLNLRLWLGWIERSGRRCRDRKSV